MDTSLESRGVTRWRSQRSNLPSSNRQVAQLEEESSDEDDNGIPPELPHVSPAKHQSISIPIPTSTSSRPPDNRVKRSRPNDQDGIVLYPGSKRQKKTGLNMTPIPQARHQTRSIYPMPTPIVTQPTDQTPSPVQSPSVGSPEDEVDEGLVRSVNNALRHLQTQQAIQIAKDTLQQVEVQTPELANERTTGESEEYQIISSDEDSESAPMLPDPAISLAQPLSSNDPHGIDDEVEEGEQHPIEETIVIEDDDTNDTASVPQTQMNGAPAREEEALVESSPHAAIRKIYDVWEVQSSPEPPSARGEPKDTRQQPQAVKRRGGRPKSTRESNAQQSSINEASSTGKRKVGRPRKNYPRLPGEPDRDYYIRIARLTKRPIPFQQDDKSDSSTNSTKVTHNPGAISSHTRTRKHDSQLAIRLHVPLEAELDKDAPPPVRSSPIGDDDFLDRRRGSKHGKPAEREVVYEGDVSDVYDLDVYEEEASSEIIDGFDTDLNDDEDLDSSVKHSFMRDVAYFNTRQSLGAMMTHDEEDFEDPREDDVTAIHLDHLPLQQMCKLMGDAAWAGERVGWQWRRFTYDGAETKAARILLKMLTRVERLYQATPKAPHLEEQNRFLKKHANMLRYYFDKINLVVNHIRTQRLGNHERNNGAAQNTDPRLRKKMTRDLVMYVLPMMTHVLTSVWALGGQDWSDTAFTCVAVELLMRSLDWIKQLHRRLLRELERCPLEEKPKAEYPRQVWLRRNAKRQDIISLLGDLREVLSAAPDRLADNEAQAKRELQKRQQRLKHEREVKERQKLAEEARIISIAERKQRSLLSIRGIYYPLGSTPASLRRSPSPAPRPTDWSQEEERFLFKKIQEAFPVAPDLDNLRWELNKTEAEMVAKTEELLGKMLVAVKPQQSAHERDAEVQRIMQRSKAH